MLTLLLAPGPLFGFLGGAVNRRRLGWTRARRRDRHRLGDRRLRAQKSDGGWRRRHGRQGAAIALPVVGPASAARVISAVQTIVDTTGLAHIAFFRAVFICPSVIAPFLAALVTAAHDRPCGQRGRWQGGGCNRPWPFALVAFRALRQRAVVAHNLGAVQVDGAQHLLAATQRPATHKVFPAGRRDGGGLALVAVDVSHVHRVVDHDVLVDLSHVARAGSVGRPVGLARCQREPAQAGPRLAARADRDVPVHAAAAAADKGDQRRSVDRLRCHAPRHPGPARADLGPAAVVKRRKAPGRVVHPGPAPGRYPAPVAGPVGRPVGRYGARLPDRAIGRILTPVAVVVELLVADGFAWHIARRHRSVLTPVARRGPGVKAVLLLGAQCGGCQLRAAVIGLLPAAQLYPRAVVAINHAATRLRHHPGDVAGGVDVEAVVARLGNDESQVGRVDFQALAFKQSANAQLEAALRQAQLGHVVVQSQ